MSNLINFTLAFYTSQIQNLHNKSSQMRFYFFKTTIKILGARVY